MQNIVISHTDRQVTPSAGSTNQLTDMIMNMHHNPNQESENTQQVYIYEEKGHWYAYGHSAKSIYQVLNKYVKGKKGVTSTYDTNTDRIEVDFKSIIDKFTIILCSDSKMVLKCP